MPPPQVVPRPPDSIAADSSVFSRMSRDVGERVTEGVRLAREGEFQDLYDLVTGDVVRLLVGFVPKILAALVVLLLFWIFYRVLSSVLRGALGRSRNLDVGVRQLVQKTFRVVMVTFAAVMALGQLGIDVTALLAGLSIIGIAVGFAAKDTLENFISGVSILLDKPFRVGDEIEVEQTYGTVEEITLRSTRIRTLNNELVIFPNIQMINQKLINHSILGIVRVEVEFGIAYKESISRTREILLALVATDARMHPDFPPSVVVTGLGASSVDMKLRFYLVDPAIEFPVRYEYLEKVREALREAGIEIPFPHLQLYIDEARAFEGTSLLERPPRSAPSGPPHGPSPRSA